MGERKPTTQQGISVFQEGISYFDINLLDNPLCLFSLKDLERFAFKAEDVSGRIIQTSKGQVYVYHHVDKKSGQEFTWSVQANAQLGWCGPLEQDFIGYVQNYALNGGLTGFNTVVLPPWRQICKDMGIAPTNNQLVKDAAQRIAGTVITTNNYFIKSDSGQRKSALSIENVKHRKKLIFTLWTYYEVGEELPDNRTAERVTLWLNEPFLSSLRTYYVRPFDYDYFRSLKPLAKRIYLIQGRKFYGLRSSQYTKEEYTRWSLQLPVVPQKHLSKAKERLEVAHRGLINTGFLERVEWVGTQKRQPWELRYYPGPRAREEVRRGRTRLRQLRAREGHQRPSGDGFDASLWADLLTTELGDTKEKNKGFYIKLARAIDAGLIRDSHVWTSLSIAKDTMRTHRLKKELSACFTDELKRQLAREGKELKDLLSRL